MTRVCRMLLLLLAGIPILVQAAAILTDIQWQLMEIQGQAVKPTAPGQQPYVAFTAAGRVEGFGGCNRFFGSYKREGNTLRLSPLGATHMACPEGMDQEGAFFDVLSRTDRFERRTQSLDLYAGQQLLARLSTPETR